MGLGLCKKGNYLNNAVPAAQIQAPTWNLVAAETFFFDLDGCIWFGDELAPGAAELVAGLRQAGRRVCFVTNITGTTAALVAEKLSSMGIPAAEADVQTPFSILPLHRLVSERSPAFVLGNDIIRAAILDAGIAITDDPAQAQLVIVSRDTALDYTDLAEASQALYGGAALLALNLDARVPIRSGVYMPGNGAIVAALTTATGVQAEAIGKPARFFFEQALLRFGAQRSSTVMIGDNLDSDIAGGTAAGLVTVQVGGDTFSQLENPPVPSFKVADLLELRHLLLD
jgi:HAD superfamily hydrolase (TIGR01450 family)